METKAQDMKAQEAFSLLKGWFNNKMTVVLFRVQCVSIYRKKIRPVDVREQVIFLNDLQHHFSRSGMPRGSYDQAIRWLKAFFRIYPMRISPERTAKAWEMIREIYRGFGLEFPSSFDNGESAD